MANFKNLSKFIQSFEGGYVNDPDDKGGETNKGITIGTWKNAGFDTSEKYDELRVGNKIYKNVTASLYKMTDAQWDQVFQKYYWSRWKADQIEDQSVANTLVDWVWASGKWGVVIPQRLLGVDQDGIVGPKTIAALNAKDGEVFFKEIQAARRQYIEDIIKKTPTNAKFRNGWLRRINSIQYGNLTLNNGTIIGA